MKTEPDPNEAIVERSEQMAREIAEVMMRYTTGNDVEDRSCESFVLSTLLTVNMLNRPPTSSEMIHFTMAMQATARQILAAQRESN